MNNQDSTIRSLHELKTLFDSGAITQEEYESLKKRIIYGNTPHDSSPPTESVSSLDSSNPVETKVIYPTPNATSRPVDLPPPPVSNPPIIEEQPDEPGLAGAGAAPVNKKDWLLITLAVLGAILLLGLIAYQFLNKPNSEHLTSKSGPETEAIIPAETPAAADPAETTSDRSDRIVGVSPDTSAITQPAPTQETPVTAPVTGTATPEPEAGLLTDKNEIISKATERLKAYYDDVQAAPFNAGNYFAPQVERYYTLTNTTPQAITENINTYHFPEFLDGKTTIQEGSMKVQRASNGIYELTYLENGSAFRKSKNQQQETKAAVRVRFNPDFKITYFRQEQLLENKFTDSNEIIGQ